MNAGQEARFEYVRMNNLPHRPRRTHRTHGTHRNRRGLRITALVVASSTALLLAACVEEDSATDGPEVEQAVGLTVDVPRVTVLDPGTGELRQLRYSADTAAGTAPESADGEDATRQTLTLSVSDGFTQSVMPAAEVDPSPAPEGADVSTMRLPLTADLTAAEPVEEETLEATREVSYTVGQPTFTDLDLAEDINSTAGFTMGTRTDDRGQQSALTFAAPIDATDTGRLIMEQYLLKFASLPVIFPEEEIGMGARWSVDSRVSGESALLQTVTYTITGISGDVVDLDISVDQRPSLGALEINPDTTGITEDTPGQLTVLNSNTASSGALSVDLNLPVPTSGEVSWTTRVVYGGAEDDLRVIQDSTTGLSFDDSNVVAIP